VENYYIYFRILPPPLFHPMKTYTLLYLFSLFLLLASLYIVSYATELKMHFIAGTLSLVGLILNMLAFIGILSIKKHA
jgi:hypothetical protein